MNLFNFVMTEKNKTKLMQNCLHNFMNPFVSLYLLFHEKVNTDHVLESLTHVTVDKGEYIIEIFEHLHCK